MGDEALGVPSEPDDLVDTSDEPAQPDATNATNATPKRRATRQLSFIPVTLHADAEADRTLSRQR